MKIPSSSKLVMIGDSITDCDRGKPGSEWLFGGLGKGYVSYVDALLRASTPSPRIRIINMGISGNTIRDLKKRWQTDVLDQKADWLSVMIGINDVWRQFDSPFQTDWHVKIDEYESTYDELLTQTVPSLKGLILMTPYFIETNPSDPMRVMMCQYGQVVKKLAEKHKALFIDTQTAFDAVLRETHPMSLAWDRVHPTVTGHMILTRAFLKTIGYCW